MGDPIARWHEEHVNFQRLLNLLERQLDVIRSAGVPNYELMLDVMYYMTHYPDLFHHPLEDLAFARIKSREGGIAPALDNLTEQHRALRRDGEALVEILDDIVNGAIRPRDAVEGRGRAYIECFRKHMEIEDREVFPAVMDVLRATDWTEIMSSLPPSEDPLFGAEVAARYAALDEQISREANLEAR